MYDDNGDGLNGAVSVYMGQVTANALNPAFTILNPIVTFTGSSTGTLMGGYRISNLLVPITLVPGTTYSVIAKGFSTADLNGNQQCVGNSNFPCLPNNAFTPPAMNTNGGLITFTGVGRVGALGVPGYDFPTASQPILGQPLIPNEYLAGTFLFDAAGTAPSATPEPGPIAHVPGAMLILAGWRRVCLRGASPRAKTASGSTADSGSASSILR